MREIQSMLADRKSVAAIVTQYCQDTHADMIVGRILEGYDYDGKSKPQLRLAALFTDQVPEKDWSRALAKKHGVPIFKTIEQALTLGTEKVAVEGVLCVGESGDYPQNAKGQQLYPSRRFLEQVFSVFERTGQVVPVYSDASLGTTWSEAKWIYDRASGLMVPLMAGSVLPWTRRVPALQLPLGCRIKDALAVGYGDVEKHGFHVLEMLQCMVERRRGGERGVVRVQCLTGRQVWRHDRWSSRLLRAALACCRSLPAAPPEYVCRETAVAFLIDYCDELEAAVLLLNGYVSDFAFAARLRGAGFSYSTVACRFHLQQQRPYDHFKPLVRAIEQLVQTGHSPCPVERTLLTTGMLDALLTSRQQGSAPVITPHLVLWYQPW